MSTTADRWRTIAGTFTARVAGVPGDAWANPSPCEGWTARDVVRHLTEWVPPFLADGAGISFPAGPSVDDDPLGAWSNVDATIQAVLDDPDVSSRKFAHDRAGTHPLDAAIAQFVLGDVLVHTWDLARATGQDERLESEMVSSMLAGIEPLGDMLEQSGHYAKRVVVDPASDEQTRLLAATGRQP